MSLSIIVCYSKGVKNKTMNHNDELTKRISLVRRDLGNLLFHFTIVIGTVLLTTLPPRYKMT